MIYEEEKHDGGRGEEETEGDGDARTMAVDEFPYHGSEEGGKGDGKEDEACAEGGPIEEVSNAEGEGGVPGCHQNGLDEGEVEGGPEAGGGEKA